MNISIEKDLLVLRIDYELNMILVAHTYKVDGIEVIESRHIRKLVKFIEKRI